MQCGLDVVKLQFENVLILFLKQEKTNRITTNNPPPPPTHPHFFICCCCLYWGFFFFGGGGYQNVPLSMTVVQETYGLKILQINRSLRCYLSLLGRNSCNMWRVGGGGWGGGGGICRKQRMPEAKTTFPHTCTSHASYVTICIKGYTAVLICLRHLWCLSSSSSSLRFCMRFKCFQWTNNNCLSICHCVLLMFMFSPCWWGSPLFWFLYSSVHSHNSHLFHVCLCNDECLSVSVCQRLLSK